MKNSTLPGSLIVLIVLTCSLCFSQTGEEQQNITFETMQALQELNVVLDEEPDKTINNNENQNLDIGTRLNFLCGVKSIALSGPFTATINDANAVFINPAALEEVSFIQSVFSYSILSMQRNLTSIGVAIRNFGIGFKNFSIRDILKTTENGEVIDGSFGSSESTLVFSYGRAVVPKLFAGASLKLFFSSIEENSALGFGFDLGLKRKISAFSFGFTFENVINRIAWNTQTERVDDLGRKLKLGAGFYIEDLTKHKDNLVISADLDFDFDYKTARFSVGTEYVYYIYSVSNIYSLSPRIGYYENNLIAGISFGLNRDNSFTVLADFQYVIIDYFTRNSDSEHKENSMIISLKLGF